MQSKLSSSCEMNASSSGGITFLGSTDKVSRHNLMYLSHEIIRRVGGTDIAHAFQFSFPSFMGQVKLCLRVRQNFEKSGAVGLGSDTAAVECLPRKGTRHAESVQ